ncbi:hypothetical protein LV779_21195, partial [Streptomyces thinghirensis]|nr:hypothetical protein [Streptomyces thinghirensis]
MRGQPPWRAAGGIHTPRRVRPLPHPPHPPHRRRHPRQTLLTLAPRRARTSPRPGTSNWHSCATGRRPRLTAATSDFHGRARPR